MAGGSWNGNLGDSPAHPDAWSRFQMGYVIPTNLTLNETNVIIPAIENDSTIFRLWTDGDIGSQYFLVENRAPIGYDAALPGFGLLTYHIDESVMTQNDNENHYLVALEQADGNYNLEFDINSGDNGDPFPGITQNRTFDYDSAPNSRDYSGVNTLVAIRNISDNGQIMTADFEIGEAVILPPDIDISANEITFTIAEGTMTDSVFTISNIAQPESQNLNWEIYEEMPGCDWLSENPTTGSIQPGNDQQVTVFVDATQLSGGNYYCNLMLSSNDPDESLLQIPVTLNVTEVNQPPLLNQIANQFVIEGDTQEVSLYAIDPDNDNLSFQVNELPLFGSLTDNGNGTGTITLMPGFDDSGIYTDIEVVVLDNGLPVLSDTVYFDITIFDRNRSPIAINDTIMLVEDSSSTIYVLENDSDPDGDQLTLLDVYSPNNGTVFVNWSESYIIYTPNNQFFGTDSLEYIIHDGKSAFDTATVYLTILSKPDLPVAVNDFLTMNEDDCQTLDVLENDYDEDEDLLSINYVNPPVNGTISLIGDSLIGYCPNTDFFGEDSFLYSITDGANGFDSARVKITINPIPDYPIAEKDSVTIREDLSVTINILENDRDPDGDQISFMGHTEPSYGNIVNVIADSALVYQPVNDFFGTDTFYYYIEDAIGLRDTALVKVVILSENDLPNLALPDSILIYTGTCDSLNLWNFVADKETADSLLTFDFDIKPDTLYLNYHPTSGILKFCAAHAEDYQNYTLSVTVRDVDLGEMIDSMIVAIREPNQVEDDLFTGIPEKFLLKQNYPNPFNPLTKIRFSIPKKCYVKVKIYDIVGREIETLVDNSMDAGRYEIEFYAEGLPSGIYFYHIQADNFNDVKKMILLK
jgi:hypothetical protein